jgi:hypothetical protein
MLGIFILQYAGSLPDGRQGFLFWAQKILNKCWGFSFYNMQVPCLTAGRDSCSGVTTSFL